MPINRQGPPDPEEFLNTQDARAAEDRYETNQREGKQTRDPDKEHLMRGAMRSDAIESVKSMFEQHGMPLHDVQFAGVADEVLPWAESVSTRADYNELMSIDPRNYVNQQNWRRGVGRGVVEKNFSPRARAQGHLLGAAAMFATAMPSPVPPASVENIRY